MKLALAFLILVVGLHAQAADEKMVSFTFKSKDLTELVDVYAKESGRKIVVDPGLRGKVTVFAPGKVPLSEAYNLLSETLALHGYGISEREDTLVVMNARDLQRGHVPVVTELPALKPERMVTYIYTCKSCKPGEVLKELRMIPSKNGEIYVSSPNRLVMTDFTSALHRIHKLLAEIDAPAK